MKEEIKVTFAPSFGKRIDRTRSKTYSIGLLDGETTGEAIDRFRLENSIRNQVIVGHDFN